MRMNESNRSSSISFIKLISPVAEVSVTCLMCLIHEELTDDHIPSNGEEVIYL